MTRYAVVLYGPRSKRDAMEIISKAPAGTRVEIKAAKRTNSQNELMWVLLTAVSLQYPVNGERKKPEKWKDVFMDGLRDALAEQQPDSMVLDTMPAIDGSGRQVNVGNSTSDLSVEEMSILIELILKFGAEHGVEFGDEREAAAA